MSDNSTSGITNRSFTKNVVGAWPVIKTFAGLAGIALVLYLQSILFTREEGLALKSASVTKTEFKEAQEDIEAVEDEVQGIKLEIHGFRIEQRHQTEQIATVIRLIEVEHRRTASP